jgi:hypothetical protein
MFQVVEWPWVLLIYRLDDAECDFGKFDKAMFQVVEKPWEVLWCLLASTKYDLGEVDKAMFHGFENPETGLSAFCQKQNPILAK